MVEQLWEGTVRLGGEVTIAAGQSLTIRPGTRVLARPGASLRVEGELTAAGAPGGGEIVFAAEGSWRGVTLSGRARASIACARFKGADDSLRCEGASRLSLSRVEILESRCVGALLRGDARLAAEDSLIALGETGVALREAAAARLLRCRFVVNQSCGVNAMMASRVLALDCRFEGNHTALSLRDHARVDLRGALLRRHHVGIYAREQSALNLVGNRFEDNAQQVELLEDARISAEVVDTPRRFEPFPPVEAAA